MKRLFCLLAAALSLAAQPKLLNNARVDTRSAAGGFEREFQALLKAQPQPAWIGYSVPAAAENHLGCGNMGNVVRLEAPSSAFILIRVQEGAVNRIRTLSPDCEIDAGGVPVHWLTDVQPAQSVATLTRLLADVTPGAERVIGALAVHADVSALNAITNAAESSADQRVRRQAVSALRSRPDGVPRLIQLVKSTKDPELRKRAMGSLSESRDSRAVAFLEEVLKH
jgi:hypothetical protein